MIRFDLDGYPSDAGGPYGHIAQPDLVDINAVCEKTCVVVLGEAGIGKTDAMTTISDRLSRQRDPTVMQLDLGSFGDASELCRELFDSPTFRDWQAGIGDLCVVLDGVDEAFVGVKQIVGLLQRRLHDLPFERLRLWVSCRTAAWPETLTTHFGRCFGPDNVDVYEVVPLRRFDVEVAASSRNLNAEPFLSAVAERQAQPFAINPASLDLLLELFAANGELPTSQVELYEAGIVRLCEQTRERQDRRTATRFTKEQRLEVATRIAGLAVLTGRSMIFTGTATVRPANAIGLSDFVGDVEGDAAGRVEVSDDAIRDALNTGLFTARGADLLGFAHKTYAEFLAARYLSGSGLAPVQRDSLLYLSDEDAVCLVPQLHETAAWLASRDPGFFEKVLDTEPEVLLMSDVSMRDQCTRARLVCSFLVV